MMPTAREQFILDTGMSPEDYLKQTQLGQQQVPKEPAVTVNMQQPVAQAAKDDTREVPYTSRMQRLKAANPEWKPPAALEAADKVIAPLQQLQDNMVSGVLQIPGSIAGLAGLVRTGVPAVAEGVYNEATGASDKGYMNAIGDAFMQRVITPEVQNNLEAKVLDFQNEIKKRKPDATAEQLSNYTKQYYKSPEFEDFLTSQLPPEFQISTTNNKLANQFAGVGKSPMQQTAWDEFGQIVGQSLVGPGPAATEAIKKGLTSYVGERIAQNMAVRAVARVAELASPVSLPLTPGNAAANVAVGTAVNEAIRFAQDEPTLVNYEAYLNKPDYAKKAETENTDGSSAAAVGGAAGVAAMFGVPGFRRAAKDAADVAAEQLSKRLDNAAQGAPTLAEQSSRLDVRNELPPTSGVVDSTAAVTQGANKYGATPEDIDDIDAVLSGASAVNWMEKAGKAVNYGELEGIANTVPLAEINRAISGLSPEKQDLLNKYALAMQRRQDGALYESSLLKEIQDAQLDLQNANAAGNTRTINAAQQRLNELHTRHGEFVNDAESSRSSNVKWTRQDVDDIINMAQQVPEVAAIGKQMEKLSHDLVDYMQANGVISAKEAAYRKRTRPMYMPLSESFMPGETNPIKRSLGVWSNRLTPVERSGEGPFVNSMTRNVSGEGANVNYAKSVDTALAEAVQAAVRTVTANNARRDVIDKLRALPNADGKLIRAHEFNLGNGRKTTSVSPEQFYARFGGKPSMSEQLEKDRGRWLKISRNGMIEMYEFGDPAIMKAMQFAPLATVPILNGTRKVWQMMQTGVAAPWFAARSALWDVPVAKATSRQGRSLGIVDTLARRLSAESPVINAIGDAVFDPTAVVSAAASIPYALGMRAARAVGQKVSQDLVTNSGVFAAIARSGPQGQAFVQQLGVTMAQAFDKSVYALFSKNVGTTLNHFGETTRLIDDYKVAANSSTGVLKSVFQGYVAMLESVQTSTKLAFFYENYARLYAKHNGKVPEGEIKKLVAETRKLTGDMTKHSNSTAVQRLTSVIPYSGAMINGTRHMLSAAMTDEMAKVANKLGMNTKEQRRGKFWRQFTTGMLLPAIGAAAVLGNWQGAEDYWYNQVPSWQRLSGIPIPDPDAITEWWQTGKLPKFSPDRLNIVPIAPEMSMVLEPVMAGLRAMGLIHNPQHTFPVAGLAPFKDVLDQVSSFATPPIIQLGAAASGGRIDLHSGITGQGLVQPINDAPRGGANADMMSPQSPIPGTLFDMVGAMLGASGQIAMQAMNVGIIAHENGDTLWESAKDAADTASFEVKRRAPQVDVPGLYNAREKLNTFTPESEYVYKTERAIDPLLGSGRQNTVENDKDGVLALSQSLGLSTAQKISDPLLKAATQVVWDALKKQGPYKEASENYTKTRVLINNLENSRYKMADDKYNDARNNYVRLQQQQTRIKAQELQRVEGTLQQVLGRRFIQQFGVPFSFETLSDLVRKDVARSE